MDKSLYINGKKCVTCCIVHIDGKALMLHDQKAQQISASITPVSKMHMITTLNCDTSDPIMNKVLETIDVDRDSLTAAFAYAAIQNMSNQFNLEEFILTQTIKIHENKCTITDIFMNNSKNKNYILKCFSLEILPNRALLDEINQTHILVDKNKVITKPSTTPGETCMDVYFMGMKMTPLTGIVTLLFWDLNYS